MKISFVLLFVALLHVAAGNGYSQGAKVTVSLYDSKVSELLSLIEEQTEYLFFYNKKNIDVNRKVSVKAINEPVSEVLASVFKNEEVSYSMIGNHIILTKNDEQQSGNQINTVSGIVTDATSNEALIGVNVVIEGTSTGTITDVNGRFSLEVPAGDVKLQFSYVGYVSQTIPLDGKQNIEIKLQPDLKTLEEVVVVGYGSVKRKDVTTSVAVVSTNDINERPMISAATAIQGKAAGVNVLQPSGEPGAGLVVRVRGNTSISTSNDPLYVVDGVPMTEINFLSPNDIESMQILKDASSAAIYGSRGANGVVVITTKAGSKGEAKISLVSSYGVTNVTKKMESLNVAQYKELMDELGAATIPSGLKDETNWFDETYRQGNTQNYQLSVTNATDKMSYYLSGGYTREAGVIKVAYYERYNFRANLENTIRDWFKITTNLAYSDYANNGIISGLGANRAGVILSVINTPTYAKIWDPEHSGQYYNNFYGANITHPVENMSRTEDDKNKNNRFVGNLGGEISIFQDLKYKPSVSLDRTYTNATTFLDPVKTSYGRSQYGNANDDRTLNTIVMLDNILTYDKVVDKNTFNFMAGSSYTTSDWNKSYMTVSHFGSSSIKTLNAGNKVEQNSGTAASQWDILSYIGRLAYNFDSKYLFTANFRADGSSKLAPGHKWGYFPSFSAAWRISSEDFMQNLKAVNDLKLRGGWGKTGNQSGISDYSYLTIYNVIRQNWWETGLTNAVPVLTPRNMKNVDLTWETTTQTSLGVDLSMFNSRIIFATDLYYKYTTNLIMDVQLPSTSPISTLTRNEGEMSNKGIEFSLSTKNFTGNFKWETDFNLSINRNKVEKFTLQKVYYYAQTSEATSEYVVRMTPGRPLSQFWGFVNEGVDPETGNLFFKDVNGDGKITLSDKTYIGDPNPDFTYGLTNNFSFKGLSLNIFIQGSQGNDIYNASRMETEGMYDAKNQSTSVLDRWRRPGMVTYMPRATAAKDNLVASTRFVEDGSYLRVKTITLSYNLGGLVLRKLRISKFQPYITAQNVLTLTRYSGFDPEVSQFGGNAMMQGIDWGTYPQSKSYIVGVNVEF